MHQINCLKKQSAFRAVTLVSLALFSLSCEQVKDEEAAQAVAPKSEQFVITGLSALDGDELSELLANSGWNKATSERFPDLNPVFGFRLAEDFNLSLDSDFEFPLLSQLDSKVATTIENSPDIYGGPRFLVVVKAATFKFAEIEYKRFSVVGLIRFTKGAEEEGGNKLHWLGNVVGELTHKSTRISELNKNQQGDYLVFASRERGFTGAWIRAESALEDGSRLPLENATVYSHLSPFFGLTDKAGSAFVVLPFASDSPIFTYKSDYNLEGYFGFSRSNTIVASKLGNLGAIAEQLSRNELVAQNPSWAPYADKLAALDLSGFVVTEFNSVLRSPTLLAPAASPVDFSSLETPVQGENETIGTEGMTDDKAEKFSRGPDSGPQRDFACNGKNYEGTPTLLEAAAEDALGWRFLGDVRVANSNYADIFGASEVDLLESYCVLTTSDALYQKSARVASIYQPSGNRVSEIWQKVELPVSAVTLQARIAILTQEYPAYLGPAAQDMIWLKFDEHPSALMSATLSQLAGIERIDASCRSNYPDPEKLKVSEDNGKCGSFEASYFKFSLESTSSDSSFFDLSESSLSNKFESLACRFSAESDTDCYSGYHPPRRVCVDIPPSLAGKTVTLRIGVGNGADPIGATALLVDTIALSSESCSAKMTGDKTLPRIIYPRSE